MCYGLEMVARYGRVLCVTIEEPTIHGRVGAFHPRPSERVNLTRYRRDCDLFNRGFLRGIRARSIRARQKKPRGNGDRRVL